MSHFFNVLRFGLELKRPGWLAGHFEVFGDDEVLAIDCRIWANRQRTAGEHRQERFQSGPAYTVLFGMELADDHQRPFIARVNQIDVAKVDTECQEALREDQVILSGDEEGDQIVIAVVPVADSHVFDCI